MQLTRLWYYADFPLYPAWIVLLAGMAVWHATPAELAAAGAYAVGGFVAWTLVEYLMHRVAFHHMPVMSAMHQAHHDAPTGMVGAPVWISAACFSIGVLLPLWLIGGRVLATSVTAGLAAGYLWYMVVHHATHYWAIGRDSWLYAAKRRHALHHHRDGETNFGVTTGFWDRVFRTEYQSSGVSSRPHAPRP
jgi:sterol desaturase/sphingolipid hydroxylase (fatty acid hydroxylase superfamily)